MRQGKLRYVALSNHPAWQLTHALWIADDRRLHAPVCVQVKYNLIDRAAERELAPACLQFGLSIVPYAPLHGGLLAGMQVLEREFIGDVRFAGSGFPEAELEICRTVERLSQDWGLRPYQVSLAWLLSRPAVASAIVGAETVEELTANASAVARMCERPPSPRTPSVSTCGCSTNNNVSGIRPARRSSTSSRWSASASA